MTELKSPEAALISLLDLLRDLRDLKTLEWADRFVCSIRIRESHRELIKAWKVCCRRVGEPQWATENSLVIKHIRQQWQEARIEKREADKVARHKAKLERELAKKRQQHLRQKKKFWAENRRAQKRARRDDGGLPPLGSGRYVGL